MAGARSGAFVHRLLLHWAGAAAWQAQHAQHGCIAQRGPAAEAHLDEHPDAGEERPEGQSKVAQGAQAGLRTSLPRLPDAGAAAGQVHVGGRQQLEWAQQLLC